MNFGSKESKEPAPTDLALTERIYQAALLSSDVRAEDIGPALSNIYEQNRELAERRRDYALAHRFSSDNIKAALDLLVRSISPGDLEGNTLVTFLKSQQQEAIEREKKGLVPKVSVDAKPLAFRVRDALYMAGLRILTFDKTGLDEDDTTKESYLKSGLLLWRKNPKPFEKGFFAKKKIYRYEESGFLKFAYRLVEDREQGYWDQWKLDVYGTKNVPFMTELAHDLFLEFDKPITVRLTTE